MQPECTRLSKKKLQRNGLKAAVFQADLTQFDITGTKFDGAFCTVDTFRHLPTDDDAIRHLQNVARHLRKKSIYILGLHLLPRNGISKKVHRWQGSRGKLTVHSNVTVLDVNRKQRKEFLSYSLRVDRKKYQSIYELRTYTNSQFEKLLAKAECFEIIKVYDLEYNPEKPVSFDSDTEEAVILLRKK